MGSTGSGKFTDYSKRKPKTGNEPTGGASGTDRCLMAFSDNLEDVDRCFYFINTAKVPPVGTKAAVSFNGTRLVAETELGEEIGYLPTKYNYLRICLEEGFKYEGIVSSSNISPIASVSVDFIPI